MISQYVAVIYLEPSKICHQEINLSINENGVHREEDTLLTKGQRHYFLALFRRGRSRKNKPWIRQRMEYDAWYTILAFICQINMIWGHEYMHSLWLLLWLLECDLITAPQLGVRCVLGPEFRPACPFSQQPYLSTFSRHTCSKSGSDCWIDGLPLLSFQHVNHSHHSQGGKMKEVAMGHLEGVRVACPKSWGKM